DDGRGHRVRTRLPAQRHDLRPADQRHGRHPERHADRTDGLGRDPVVSEPSLTAPIRRTRGGRPVELARAGGPADERALHDRDRDQLRSDRTDRRLRVTPRSLLALVTPVAPSAVWGAWTFDPLVVAGSIAAAVLYAPGHRYLGARLDREARSSASRRAMAFACGLATTDLALLSPLHAMSDALFSAHMVQHLVLIVVAA